MNPIPILILLGAAAAARWLRKTIVHEYEAGLLYENGRFVRRLEAGGHWIWTFRSRVEIVDMRRTSLTVAGQEVLSSESVGLKVSLVVSYRVADAVRATQEVQQVVQELYLMAQIALRKEVAGHTLEAMLQGRLGLGEALTAALAPPAETLGLQVLGVDVKDVMIPGELKKAFSEVLKSKQEGLAALERARGETAALRNLANAAKLMDGNPALLNLRLLQAIENPSGAGGNTLVMGVPQGFVAPAAKSEGTGKR